MPAREPEVEALAASFARALAPAFDRPEPARALAERLAAAVRHPDDPEASVRWSARGIRGGRMMIERTERSVVRMLAEGLGLPWPEPCERLLVRCEHLGLPLIGGWDAGPTGVRYKLYANASDASGEHQQQLASALALCVPAPPQVVGLNVSTHGVEAKAYVQRRSRAALERSVGLPPLPDALMRYDVPTTWVASLDATPRSHGLRAVFVAVHDGTEAMAEALVQALTGQRWPRLAQHLPFAPGPLRQLGWGTDGSVTAYAKPAGTAPPVHALAPHAVFRAGAVEVGLYIEPSERTPRAFMRTPKHALTLRERAGRPSGPALEQLGRWAHAQVLDAERQGGAPRLDEPPAPWRRVPS